MTSPNYKDLVLFEQILRTATSIHAVDQLCQRLKLKAHRGIYRIPVVIWFMIYQRLQSKGTLSEAVHFLARQAVHGKDQPDICKRIFALSDLHPHGRVWSSPAEMAHTDSQSSVRSHFCRTPTAHACPADGSGASGIPQRRNHAATGTRAGVEAGIPAGTESARRNHWPTMLLVAFHDALTGLAMRPSWGAMYGRKNTSEQALAREAVQRLPSDAVAMADSHFGIFWFAYEGQQSQRDRLLRLTPERAQKVLPSQILRPGRRRKVQGMASAQERRVHSDWPSEAVVSGWVSAGQNPDKKDQILYFFSSLDLIPKRILAIYKLRWNIETDLRSLKRTLELHPLTSKTKAMVEKEVLMAVCAYHGVRATMYWSASQAGLTPRPLSFSASQDAVMAAWPYLQRASSPAEFDQEIEPLLEVGAQQILPSRSGKRSYPRQIWGRGGHFPFRRSPAKEAK